jgi:cytochrome c6
MTKFARRMFSFATPLAFVLTLSLSAHAQDGAAIYKTRCAMCHGADGAKLTAHNLQTADVQKLSDTEISGIISNGKGKMPPSKSLKPDEVSAVVGFVRTLKK